ncbi:arginine--tRNA ligase [Ruminiclostridium cellulolyticum]|uniref:Arginine--tRNA ligase n=1 Tax=Ruminiclostridium cellulolyticum (strain ATCC 35319 / DSM 5812 / JCM 6584 / H10) TaxID=394503 RepID=SYR_RUMCH|nr:arginine--tRNA ligase [Ruminiclostridium cellulolyticum]B8I592.1 RecName: Full=Arginine--tRNA ligase; AltName: Full=Arginyl-tRNA synthetase; Short=ArgRS [Ruminiclostridium cellulolyticum H10]ACL74672.1 arginyl-tRNA synthetase [Ruminiclostridium cellulolyticum H10]
MKNINSEIRQQIRNAVINSINKSVETGELPSLEVTDITIEIPREKGHGDFSTNVAMQITKAAKKAPRQIADIIIKNIVTDGTYIDKVTCAGPGFINFTLDNSYLYETVNIIQQEKENYGRINIGNGKKVMVEFVSANPTGPLHMGNARGGALGDCIASVLDAAGYNVTREFLINDAGNQIEKFGTSLEARYIQLIKGEDAIEFPEDGYQGEDITEHMKDFIAIHGDKYINTDSEERKKVFVDFALPRNIARIKEGLESYGIHFDIWFSEQSLHKSGEVAETIQLLKDRGCTVEKEGALWLKGSVIGSEKDEVLVRNNGIPTYFAADIAYHRNKFEKRGFEWVINLWGADHHGHVARMKAAMAALGINPDKLDVVLFQLVRLYRNGEIARMSKRTGKSISLMDLVEEVGRDGVRYFFNTKASGSHLDFDLDLAVKQSNENPVFYVQYAHARICSMFKLLESEGIKVPSANAIKAELLDKPEELELIRKLSEYPDEVRISAETLEPSRLTRYVHDVASTFHSFYNACRVRGEEEELMQARLVLVDCTRIVVKNVLDLLSITAPERM